MIDHGHTHSLLMIMPFEFELANIFSPIRMNVGSIVQRKGITTFTRLKRLDHDDHGHRIQHEWFSPMRPTPKAMMLKLDNLVAEIDAELQPVKGRGYVVFHDAYQYFENRFGVSAVGSITVSPEVLPGAERVAELREKVRNLDATCVFSEPQFEPKLVMTITENTNAGTGVLDPLGASIDDGPELYFTLIETWRSL